MALIVQKYGGTSVGNIERIHRVAERVEREPMKGTDRLAFVRQFALGLALLCIAYFFLTAYRDFRDNYQVEIFDGLGYPYKTNKAIITKAKVDSSATYCEIRCAMSEPASAALPRPKSAGRSSRNAP